jgi:hypothetical protein
MSITAEVSIKRDPLGIGFTAETEGRMWRCEAETARRIKPSTGPRTAAREFIDFHSSISIG